MVIAYEKVRFIIKLFLLVRRHFIINYVSFFNFATNFSPFAGLFSS